jgi:hypothetical protein
MIHGVINFSSTSLHRAGKKSTLSTRTRAIQVSLDGTQLQSCHRAGLGETRADKEELGNSFEYSFEEVRSGEGNGQHRKQQNCIIGLLAQSWSP